MAKDPDNQSSKSTFSKLSSKASSTKSALKKTSAIVKKTTSIIKKTAAAAARPLKKVKRTLSSRSISSRGRSDSRSSDATQADVSDGPEVIELSDDDPEVDLGMLPFYFYFFCDSLLTIYLFRNSQEILAFSNLLLL